MKTPEVIAILAIVFLIAWFSTNEDDTNQPTITIRYKCELVLRSQHDIPKHVIENCKKLLKEDDE